MSEADIWEKVGSTIAYDGFVKVNRETYKEPDGQTSEWDVIVSRDSVATLAFTSETRELVLFEQFRVGPGLLLRELPGGYLNAKEEPIEAALRELKEETGYSSISTFYGGAEWWTANSSRRKHVVIAAGASLDANPSWDQSEMGRVLLIPQPKIVEFFLSGELTDAGLACRGLMKFAQSAPQEQALVELQNSIRKLL